MALQSKDEKSARDRVQAMRAQRDRFVAFAFAGSDLLLEIAPDGLLTFAIGMAEVLCGQPAESMPGHPIGDYVLEEDRYTLNEALQRIGGGGRFDSLQLTLTSRDGRHSHAALFSGICSDPAHGLCHLSVRRLSGAALAAATLAPAPGRHMETGEFIDLVQERMKTAEPGRDDYALTLVDVEGAADMTAEETDHFFRSVEGYLRTYSLGGTSVGRLRDDKFGVLSDQALDREEMSRRISTLAHDIAPDAPPPQIHAAEIELDLDTLSPQDLTKALVYTINKFVAEGGDKVSITSLTEGYRAAMADTLSRVGHFRSVINSEQLHFAYQPIVHLGDWRLHHFEALARICQNGQTFLPSSFVTFAEDVGLVSELDMVVCRQGLATLRENRLIPPGSHIAVNLSGRSVSNGAFMAQLLELLETQRDLLPRLLFEVTESAEMRNLDQANWVVQKLRALGCRVCLDDFGAGAASFPYLRALEVDFVKIDGSYIMDAFDTHYGLPFLRAIAHLCRDMHIATIGEMVEDARTVKVLRSVGIGFAQGYFFSRPAEDASAFVMPDKPGAKTQIRA